MPQLADRLGYRDSSRSCFDTEVLAVASYCGHRVEDADLLIGAAVAQSVGSADAEIISESWSAFDESTTVRLDALGVIGLVEANQVAASIEYRGAKNMKRQCASSTEAVNRDVATN